MTAIVIDTNVLVVADGKSPQMTDACRTRCEVRLMQVRAKEQVVLDDGSLMLDEYYKNLLPYSSPTPGSEFLKWLLEVEGDSKHVAKVTLTPRDPEQTVFDEFPPDAALQAVIDPSDRKYFAASYAHPEKPPILECTDSKWLGWEDQLKKHGIKIEFLCRDELEAIRKTKTKKK